MSTLRVLLAAAPQPALDAPWAIFDAEGRHARSGFGKPSTWPDAQRREAVLAASAVRLVSVTLPPMPADRVAAAAAFALEDQLAGPAQAQHLVASARRRDGAVEVAVASRALLAPLQQQFSRVVAEPSLAPLPSAGTWRWHASGLSGAFVRKPDGSAFAVNMPSPDARVPAELALALAQAARSAPGAPNVEVTFPVDDAQLDAWTAKHGTTFKRGVVWHWDQDGKALDDATDLLQGEFSQVAKAVPRSSARGFRIAAGIAIAAVALHVAATLAQWAWLRFDTWQTERALVATARDAGVADAADADAASLLARKFSDARHLAGQSAPSDAVPMLARAAPALALLPPGTLRTATYSPGTWTFDLGKLDAVSASSLDRSLTAAGLATLSATNQAGTRLRATLAPASVLPLMALSLHSLSPAAASAWERASPRERAMVELALIVVALAIAYAWIWQPMRADIERMQRDLPRAKGTLAAARAQSDALAALTRATPLVKRSDPRTAVERALAERGLRPAVGSLDLVDGRVRLVFPAVRFDILPGVLDALARSDGLYVADAVLTPRVEPGTVRAEMSLSR